VGLQAVNASPEPASRLRRRCGAANKKAAPKFAARGIQESAMRQSESVAPEPRFPLISQTPSRGQISENLEQESGIFNISDYMPLSAASSGELADLSEAVSAMYLHDASSLMIVDDTHDSHSYRVIVNE
jgi:hypothetical protein